MTERERPIAPLQASRRLSVSQVWAMPLLLAIVSLIGLLAALLADGLGDALSWALLAAPVTMIVWYSLRPSRTQPVK